MGQRRKFKLIPLVAVMSCVSMGAILIFAIWVSAISANRIVRDNTTKLVASAVASEFADLRACLNTGNFCPPQAYTEAHPASGGDVPAYVLKAQRSLAIGIENCQDVESVNGIPTLMVAEFSKESSEMINIIALPLSEPVLERLAGDYLLTDLRLGGTGTNTSTYALMNAKDEVIAELAWEAPSPGMSLAWSLFPILAASVGVAIVFAWYVGRIAQSIADKLRKNVKESQQLARTDTLTGLPNRLAFQERLTSALSQNETDVALIAADINNFKSVNDTMGHNEGDRLIEQVAERIQHSLTDEIFLARIGGDEFVFLLADAQAEEKMGGAANAVRSALEQSFYIGGNPLSMSMSMGMTVRPKDAVLTEDELMRQADKAMYQSKASAGKLLTRYNAAIEPSRANELRLETELRNAIDNPEQFSLRYQPIINSGTSTVGMAEALLRWNSPTLGRVSPADFIPVAEQTGLIRKITSIVLDKVCNDVSKAPDLSVSVNISPAEICDPLFHDDLVHKIRQYNIRPDQITLELTEGVVVENPRGLAVALQKLRLMGHQIVLDDFGTGYSSIGYLRQMEFSLLKVDKSLVEGVTRNKQARDVLHATLNLAKAIGIRVLAEGVETAEQAKLLKEMGVDMQQGFNFSAGLEYEDLLEFAQNLEMQAA